MKSPAEAAAAAQAAAACRRAVAYSASSTNSKLAAALGGFEPVMSLLQLYRLDGNLMSAGEQQYEISITVAAQLEDSWSVQLILWMVPDQQQQQQASVSRTPPAALSGHERQMQEHGAPRKLLSKQQGKQEEQEVGSPSQPGSPKQQQQADSLKKLERGGSAPYLPIPEGPGAKLQKAYPVLITARKGRLSSISHANVSQALPEAGTQKSGVVGESTSTGSTGGSGGSSSRVMWVGAQAAVAYKEEVLGPVHMLPASAQASMGGNSSSNVDDVSKQKTGNDGGAEDLAMGAVMSDVRWICRSWFVRPADWPGQQVAAVGLGLVAVTAAPRTRGHAGNGVSDRSSNASDQACDEKGQRFFIGKESMVVRLWLRQEK